MAGLPNSLVEELNKFRQSRAFNVEGWTQQKVTLLNDYMRKAGLKACVVSVSGGVDSACIFGMCLAAQAQPGSPIQKVLGVAQPIHSTASIWKRALECEQMGEKFGVKAEVIVVDQTPVFDQLSQIVETAAKIEGQSFARGQLKSYMRTPVGYYVAQLLSQAGTPAIVMGTGNFDEDGYLCYFCKAGDGVVDVQLIADLHKSEVFQVSRHVGVPESILGARPSADLWEGQSDEDELGFSYDFVELFTEYLKLQAGEREAFEARLDEEGLKYFRETADKARQVHRRNSHKLNSPFNINILDTQLLPE